jgi:signal transduction histidine kinase
MRRGTGTVRMRATLAALLVVGVAMVFGVAVLLAVLRELLTEEVAAAARARASEIATQVASNDLDEVILAADPDDELVQVVDGRGRVVLASKNVSGAPVALPGQNASAELRPGATENPMVVVSVPAGTERGLSVLVGRSTKSVTDVTILVARLLAVGLPTLLLVIAALTWRLVGRSLAPVEAIRREVDAISASELHRRVPAPATVDEIGRLARTMNEMLGRLERSHERQRRFVADASHELRSPVAAIRQHAEVTLAHPAWADAAELAGTVLAEGLRIQGLIDDLLLLARADERNLLVRQEPLDVDDLVFDEARRLRATGTLRIDTTAVSAGRVDGDVAGLRRVLLNLGDNAARHARSRVAFAVAEQNGAVVLDIDDDGPGIDQADRERVKERFVRLDEARTRDAGGSGLGLAIVVELVAAHHGSVEITGSPLGGARIEVRLPRTAESC